MFIHRTRLNCAQVDLNVSLWRQDTEMRRRELPENLPIPAFTLAQAKELGVSRSRTTAADLQTPSRGLRLLRDAEADFRATIRSHLLVTPGGFASHITAAKLWRVPLPAWADARIEIDIARKRPAAAPRRKDVVGHRLRISRAEITCQDRLWLTTPARTWRDLASVLAEEDLVVAGDFLVRTRSRDFGGHREALCSVGSLADLLPERAKANALRRAAAAKVRLGVDSPQETRLRLRLVAAGLPEPAVDHSLDDEFDGRPIRWADLAYPEYKIVIQYEGDHHLSRRQLAADIARDEDWRNAGWTVVRLTATDLQAEGAYAAAKVRAVLLRAGWMQA